MPLTPIRQKLTGMTPEERFHASYRVAESGCWEWVAGKIKGGKHGTITVSNDAIGAHVYSYSIHKGPVPDGGQVCHSCDNGCCVNPDHLWLGTRSDNMRDAAAKGRIARGERNGTAKLTEDDVRAIRADPRKGLPVARDYGISEATVSMIRSRKRWAHIV